MRLLDIFFAGCDHKSVYICVVAFLRMVLLHWWESMKIKY